MPIAALVGDLIVSLFQNGAYDGIKAGFKSSESLTVALQRAAKQASEDFFNRFGNEFGTGQDSFLARQDNWNTILQSLFYSSGELSASSLDPRGYAGVKTASDEAVQYFVQCIKSRIKGNQALDQHFAHKDHIEEQTEVKESVTRIEQTLLEVKDEERQGRQDLVQRLESMQSLMSAFDVGREKDVANELIDEQIDLYRDLINDNQPSAAISILEKLKTKKWEALPDRLRFRVVTNIAAAKLRIGNDNRAAAQELLQAEKLAPMDKKALVNSVLAHWLLENPAAARKKAEETVRLFPNDPESYQALLIGLADYEDCQDPLTVIPPELLSSPELCLQIGDFFHRKNNLLESRKWIRRAYGLRPTDTDIQEAYSATLLEELLAESAVAIGRQMTHPQRKQMEEARIILTSLWANARDTEVSARYIPCVINLSIAERLLGNQQKGMALIEEALQRHPDQIPLQKQRCVYLSSEGRIEETYEALRKMPDDAFEEKLLIEADMLAALDKPADALTTIERFLSHRPATKDTLTAVAHAVRVQLMSKVKGSEVALAAALRLAEDDSAALEYLLLVSDMLSGRGEKDAAIEWAHKARAVAVANDNYSERAMVADTYSELGLHREAASLYKDLVTSYEDSRNLRRLISSYLSGDFRPEVHDLISLLPEHVKELRFYGRACAELFYRLGDLPTARGHLERCIKEAPEDLELQLNYLTLLERMGQKNDVRQRLHELPLFGNASPVDLVKLSHAYARYNMQDKALQVGYDTLCRFGSLAVAHVGYCSLVLETLKDVAEIDRVRNEQKVDIDTAFTCVTEAGKRLTFIIERNAAQDAPGEINPENVVAKKTIGLRVNDTFLISETPFGKEEATITEVKHKYLHALHESMTNFQYRFPDVPAMWMVSLAPSADDGMDLQPILDIVSKKSHAVLGTEEIYANNPLPLALVAHHLGIHPIDCLLGMSQGGRVQIKCCNGVAEERAKAFQTIMTATNGFIIDAFSLYTLQRLQLLDVLLAIAQGSVGITQSTLDFFAELVEDRKSMQPFMSLSKENGQFFRNEVSKADILLSIEPFTKLLAWCRDHCEIVPAIGKPSVNEEGKLLFFGLHPTFLDTLLAASGTGRLLISEDLHYRQVGMLLFDVEGVWSQPLLQLGHSRRLLSAEQYHESVLQMVKMNYSFISLSAADLIFHLAKTDFVVNEDFVKLLNTLSAPKTNLPSAILLVSIFLRILLQKTGSKTKIEKVIYATLTRLASNPASTQIRIVIALFRKLAIRMAFEKDIKEADIEFLGVVFENWRFGHFVSKG